LAAGSIDAVVTDPPFFDNVHYSELADFFYVWQRHILDRVALDESSTTRRGEEVQSTEASEFANRLKAVFEECCRVLRDDGLLVFTYHHSRPSMVRGETAQAAAVLDQAERATRDQFERFAKSGRALGYGDLRVVLAAHVVKSLSRFASAEDARRILETIERSLEMTAAAIDGQLRDAGWPQVGQLRFAELEEASRG
jgi:hypothetical protein